MISRLIRLRSFRYIVPASLLLLFVIGACADTDTKILETPAVSTPVVSTTPPSTRSASTSPTPRSTETQEAEDIVRLPEDEGVHLSPLEWWYFNGHVDTEDGRTFSYHFVTFQSVLDSGLTPRLTQLSWADHEKGIHLIDEKTTLLFSEASSGEFDLTNAGWRMSGDGERFGLSFTIGEYTVELEGFPTKPPTLHHDTGYVDLGIAGKTYYYSHTNLDTSGTVSLDGASYPVEGTTWMDHQWGDFSIAQIGWDWFSLNLDDGSDLMVSVVWEQDGPKHIETYGTYTPPGDHPSVHLPGNEISVEPIDTWTSPETGGEYPMGWRVRIDSLNLDLLLTPVMREAEFTETGTIPVIYWEGAVKAEGSRNGTSLTGRGFVELVGYVPAPLPGSIIQNGGPIPSEAPTDSDP